jgi:hypothetical protein
MLPPDWSKDGIYGLEAVGGQLQLRSNRAPEPGLASQVMLTRHVEYSGCLTDYKIELNYSERRASVSCVGTMDRIGCRDVLAAAYRKGDEGEGLALLAIADGPLDAVPVQTPKRARHECVRRAASTVSVPSPAGSQALVPTPPSQRKIPAPMRSLSIELSSVMQADAALEGKPQTLVVAPQDDRRDDETPGKVDGEHDDDDDELQFDAGASASQLLFI